MIYVDVLRRHPSGEWCHLFSDESTDELHELADRIGMKRAWYQSSSDMPHYDLRPSMRVKALAAGAREISDKNMVAIIQKWRARKCQA